MTSRSTIKKTLKCLDAKRLEDVDEMKKVGSIIKHALNEDGFELFNDWSKSAYEEKVIKKVWRKLEATTLTIDTLKLYAKDDNIFEYSKYFNKLKLTTFTTSDIAEYFKELYGDRFIYTREKLYYFNGVYWVTEDRTQSNLNLFISKRFYKLLQQWIIHYSLENLEEKDEDKRDGNKLKLDKWRKECDALLDHKRREKFIKEIICEINNKDIEFDEKPYLFAFKNKIYDLQKCEFVHPNHLDYISLTTGYDYEDNYDKSKIDELDKLIDTIFPEKDVKDFYLCILSTGLEGKTLEKFTIANGGGRNGKGVLNELMLDTVGNYGYVLAANTFNGELKKGNNPELANIYNKRFVNSREPNASIPINTSTMKELTGGDRICTRTNYSEDTHIKLKLTLVFECNKKPLLSNTDTAEIERVEDVPFISTFLSKANYDALDECDRVNKFIGNKFYKEQAFKDQYKQALFEILVKHYQLYTLRNFQLPVSKVIQDRNREYFAGCDGLYQWILENYENTGSDKDRIKIKLLYQEFKNSEYYSNLTKVEKNNYTPKKFQETLQNNMFLKKFITKNKSGVLELRKHALREEDDDSEDEEDDKTPKKEFIDDEDEDEDDEEDDVIEEVVPKKRTVIAESSDDESDDEVVVKKAVKYYVEPNPCRGGD